MSTTIPGVHDVIRMDDPLLESIDPVIAHAHRLVNHSLRGRLEVDYDARQITLTNIPGDHAMRFHKLVSDYRDDDPSSARWADHLDPRTADAGDGWITFDVKRVLAVRWIPERLIAGDAARRQLLCAAIRLVQHKPNLDDPASLSTQTLADYGEVLLDMGGFTEAETGAESEGDSDDFDEPEPEESNETGPDDADPDPDEPPPYAEHEREHTGEGS